MGWTIRDLIPSWGKEIIFFSKTSGLALGPSQSTLRGYFEGKAVGM
jgi:hypothetical protein